MLTSMAAVFIILTLITAVCTTYVDVFDVRKNQQIVAEANATTEVKSISEIHCAYECSLNGNCCKTNYNKDDNTCKLFLNCCYRETETSEGVVVLTKSQDQVFTQSPKPVDCTGIPVESGSGVYDIYPDGINMIKVYCEMDIDGGGWTVFQRRFDGSESFYRNWNDYETGFGCPDNEYWLGNSNLNQLTSTRSYSMRVELEDFNGGTAFASYDVFQVGTKISKYRVTVSGYQGNAGDAIISNMKFTTYDRDHDTHGENCAVKYQGAWWYWYCSPSNLNGLYIEGDIGQHTMHWRFWHSTEICLKKSMMRIK